MPRTLSARFRRAHRVVVPLAAAPLLLGVLTLVVIASGLLLLLTSGRARA
jgi:hypothetical protein